MADIREIIHLELSSLSQLPPKHRDRGRRLANVATKQTKLYKETKTLGDLEQAVDLLRAAVEATPLDHVRRPKRLNSLGVSLGRLYRHNKSESHLAEAIDRGREATAIVSGSHADRATYLSDLGIAIWDRYHLTDSVEDLYEFLRLNRQALGNCTLDHPRRFKFLNDMGAGLGEQYMKTGSLQDLQDAVAFGQASVDETPDGHANQARHLANLSVAIGDRYLVNGSMDDLESAMFYAKTAVDKATANDRERGRYLNNLAIRYLERYIRTKSTIDWQAALDSGKAAVAATHSTDLERAVYLDNLAKCYHDRYKELGTSDLLEEAIDHTRAAMRESRVSQDHTNQARRSFNLGTTLGVRYKDSGQIDDLQESIGRIEKAVNRCPKNFPERARYLHDLGVDFYDRFQKQQDLHDVRLASPQGRDKAANIAIEQQEWQLAAAYLSECIDLVPKISSRSNSHDDLHRVLQQLSGLGSIAAWVYLRAGRSIIESLQALEQCRGIISSLIMDSRSDTSLLREAHPEIAARYCGLRDAVARRGLLNGGGTVSFEKNHYVSESLKLAHDLKSLEDLEVEIRKLPSFDRFQLPLTENEMLDLSKQGPLVSVNMTDYGCQAFLLANDCIRRVELLKVTSSDVIKHISWRVLKDELSSRDLKHILSSSQASQESKAHQDTSTQNAMIESMQWLWKALVQPILAEMGLLSQTVPPSSLPCLWWINSGEMALLPFHAAGSHGPESTENTLSHVSSSYIPTMKMLHHSRKRERAHRVIDKILVVTMLSPLLAQAPNTNL